MGKAETGAMVVEAPLLILRTQVDTTSELLSKLLQSMTTRRGWGGSNAMHELSHITASDDTRGHTALLYTGHTDDNGATYPAAVWYALNDLSPTPAARVMLMISARLHSSTVLDHVYDVLKLLRASYPNVSVELAETSKMFVDRDEALLPCDYDFLITPVISLGGQSIEPAQEPPPRRRSSGHGVGRPVQRPAAKKTTTTRHTRNIEKAKSAKYGTERDLTYDDVKEIVTRCKAYQARGGKVPAFYRSLKLNETGPRAFTLETLRKWLKNPYFESETENAT